MKEDQSQTNAGGNESSGLELIGGGLFLAGCLPAAALVRAIGSGTDLSAPGLGKAAKLAAAVADWVGAWPGLATSGLIAGVGALMVVGTIRREPMRYIAGAIVSGFGLAAIASGFAAGAGGQIGEGVAGLAGGAVSVVVGLIVVGVSVWLAAFAPSAVEDEPEAAAAPSTPKEEPESIVLGLLEKARTGVSGLRERAAARGAARAATRKANRPTESAAPRAAREPRRIQTKRKRPTSAPATLGEAFARDETEGVSHDEAAALAPDAKALAYMENVWRNASESFRQAEPLPPSPYPEDVRLRGGIPDGATPLTAAARAAEQQAEADAAADAAREAGDEAAAPRAEAPAASAAPQPSGHDVAPFDFRDEFGAQAPLQGDDAPGGADDPFAGSLGEPTPLHPAEAAALEPTLRREAPAPAAGELPEGVKFLDDAYDSAFGAPPAPAESASAVGGAHPVEPTAPPAPSWEAGYDESEYDYGDAGLAEPLDASPLHDEPIPEVDPATGHWARRAGEDGGEDRGDDRGDGEPIDGEAEATASLADLDEPGATLLDFEPLRTDGIHTDEASIEVVEPVESPADVEAAAEEVEVEAEDDPAAEAQAEDDDEDVEYEYVDEDGNPIAASELAAGDWEEVEEEEEADDDAEWEEAELEDGDAEDSEEDADDEEDVEYEYVDEDGNPIDASELEDGEWEEVEEDGDEAEESEAEEAAEAEEPEVEESEVAEESAEAEEPEVVLEPQPAPKAAAGGANDDTRLLEAGLLLVREGRVAVSLLQRNLDIEFDEACELLDELQSAGLIGPYKNGKARDILMDADQWESLFVGA